MPEVATWLTLARCRPIDPRLVPGATVEERRQLAALGGLVRALLDGVPASWPAPLKAWVAGADPPPAAVIKEARKRLAEPTDFFAALYESVVAGPNRRRLGTFFTPPEVVEFMIARSADVMPFPEQIVDPGAGVGAFSVAAAKRWPDAKVRAIDVNLVTLGLLAARLAIEGQTEQVDLVLRDFLTWIEDDVGSGARLFLGNPPYTRHQELSQAMKTRALRASGDLVNSGLAGLAAYFLAASLEHLRSDDALCFVLPGSWTEARHGSGIRKWLWEHRRRVLELLAFPSDLEIFPGTRVNAVVATVGPESQSTTKTDFATRSVQARAGRLVMSTRNVVDRGGRTPSSFGALLWPPSSAQHDAHTVALSSLGHVRRGVATGANHFFFLTDAEAEPVPSRLLRPGLRRVRDLDGTVLDQAEHDRIGAAGRRRWLLTLGGPADCKSKAVAALLAVGEAAGYHERYLTKIRTHWYVLEAASAPQIIVSMMSKDGFRTVLNEVGAIPSNSMYGIHLDDPTIADRLCRWLNSDDGQIAIRSQARHYSEGLLKLEPRDYAEIRVPAELPS